MRLLIMFPVAAGLALIAAGAAAPGRFVLVLLGLALLTVSVGLGQASLHRPGPRAHT